MNELPAAILYGTQVFVFLKPSFTRLDYKLVVHAVQLVPEDRDQANDHLVGCFRYREIGSHGL